MVEMKGENRPLMTVPGEIFIKYKIIVNGGFEIGLLPKVKNLNLRYFKAIVDNFILFCWYRSWYWRQGLGLSFHFHYLRPSGVYVGLSSNHSAEASFGRFKTRKKRVNRHRKDMDERECERQ